jgi:hypothetical protein
MGNILHRQRRRKPPFVFQELRSFTMTKNNDFLMKMVTQHGDKVLSEPKALAYFLFRELVEDIHAAGHISQDEMKELNRRAVNRAKLFLDLMYDKRKLPFALLVIAQNTFTKDWDEPVETEEIAQNRAYYRLRADKIIAARRG